MLAKAGAALDAKDNNGLTAAQHAAALGHAGCSMLIAAWIERRSLTERLSAIGAMLASQR